VPAKRLGVTRQQVALAWVHHQQRRRGQQVVPLPGATSVAHLQANIAAASIELTEDELQRLDTVRASRTEAAV
jgi:aryl-alcohol dehydrogenase-like predicted oxidoreductase